MGMNREKLQQFLTRQTDRVWDRLCESYPRLVRYNPPAIKLNGRLWRTAGFCHQNENVVELGYKFFIASHDYYAEMIDIILPHEIIHQADFNLFGESEKKCGHGKNWCAIMQTYGLSPQKYHNMEISR
jgi:predicted SprT family Zn-dependent metalloprotease